MLDICNQHRVLARVKVILLHCVVPAQSEQSRSRAIVGDGRDAIDSRDDVVRDLFGAYVPGVGGAVQKISISNKLL